MYKTADAVFNKNGIIVFTGPPGCGKSIGGGGIHLIRKELHDWTSRKLHSLEELAYIDEKSLVFIDNIFFRRTMDSDLGS